MSDINYEHLAKNLVKKVMDIYEVPSNVHELFLTKEAFYRIIDYSLDMNNIQSMQFFLDYVGIEEGCVVQDLGTQVIVCHEDFDYKLQIDSGGLGDFFSHGFEVVLIVCVLAILTTEGISFSARSAKEIGAFLLFAKDVEKLSKIRIKLKLIILLQIIINLIS